MEDKQIESIEKGIEPLNLLNHPSKPKRPHQKHLMCIFLCFWV